MIKVAIIDDGVSSGVFPLCHPLHSVTVNDSYEVKASRPKNKQCSHGTTCAAIICQNIKVEVQLYSIKVKASKKNGDVYKLKMAVDFCIDNQIDIVNLSIGSTNIRDKQFLYEVAFSAYSQGLIIVSALSNDGKETFPASSPWTISAKHTEKARSGLYYYKKNLPCFVIGTYGKCDIVLADKTTITVGASNSYATAILTSEVINIVSQLGGEVKIDDVKKELLARCINL